MTTALVLGGTGAVGGAVVAALAARDVAVTFTYRRSIDKAEALTAAHGARGIAVELADLDALDAVLAALPVPDVIVACAAASPGPAFVEQTAAGWREIFAVNVDATAAVCRWRARAGGPGDIVLVGGLDRGQSLPLPPAYAASQGALSALTMALAHELGGGGLRVNLVALGVLDAGLSRQLSAGRRKDYQTFSALRREGTPAEAAAVITWLALENRYIHGKVIAANGGI